MEAAVSEKKRHLPQPRMKAITWKQQHLLTCSIT
jgi:hypothetical protein